MSAPPSPRREILFFGEPLLQRAILRFLRYLRPEWNVMGATSERDAKLLLDSRKWDLVLAEVTPYAAGGAELLRYARCQCVGLPRVAYSGSFEQEHPEVRRAHRVLPNPTGLDQFVGALDQQLRDASQGHAA